MNLQNYFLPWVVIEIWIYLRLQWKWTKDPNILKHELVMYDIHTNFFFFFLRQLLTCHFPFFSFFLFSLNDKVVIFFVFLYFVLGYQFFNDPTKLPSLHLNCFFNVASQGENIHGMRGVGKRYEFYTFNFNGNSK